MYLQIWAKSFFFNLLLSYFMNLTISISKLHEYGIPHFCDGWVSSTQRHPFLWVWQGYESPKMEKLMCLKYPQNFWYRLPQKNELKYEK
jgi:hypothetical protein